MAGLSRPRFSVIVSALGRCELFPRALRSLNRQKFTSYEVILLTNENRPTVEEKTWPSIRFVGHTSTDPGPAAWNAGLALAAGEIVAFLEPTDLWHPNYLTYQDKIFRLMPNALFGFTNYYLRSPSGSRPIQQMQPCPDAPNAAVHMAISPFIHTLSTFAAPARAIAAAGGFNEALSWHWDVDLYLRLLGGPGGRKQMACLVRPAVGLPHFAVMREELIAAGPPPADEHSFIDHICSYPFMAPYKDMLLRSRVTSVHENISS